MTDRPISPSSLAVVAGCLLLTTPLAGCLEPIGEATQDALTDPNASSTQAQSPAAGDGDGQADEEALAEGEVADTYEAAFSSVEPGSEGVDRVSMGIHAEPEGSDPYNATVYWNAREEISVIGFANGTPGGAEGTGAQLERLLIATVNKTTFFGTPPAFAADYNASESWEEDPFNLSEAEGTGSMNASGESLRFSQMLDEMGEIPEDAEISSDTITYEGQQAREIEISYENETGEVYLRAVIDAETELPLLVEGTMPGFASQNEHLTMTFAYGEDADHAYADEFVRLEAMTILPEDGESGYLATGNETRTWIVQPSRNPGMIELEQVEVVVRSSGQGYGAGETEHALAAEDGRLTNEDVELVYEDLDGDGAVSPGDEVRFTPRSEEAESWTVYLKDEKTGMHVTPGPGLAAALASLAGLAVFVRTGRQWSG